MKKTWTKLVMATALLLGGACLWGEQTEPRFLNGDLPDYSLFARSHGVEGTVVIEALVDQSGRIFAAEVVKSVHRDLDTAALSAVKEWSFKPAETDGRPVMSVVRIPVRFQLVNPEGDPVTGKEALASR